MRFAILLFLPFLIMGQVRVPGPGGVPTPSAGTNLSTQRKTCSTTSASASPLVCAFNGTNAAGSLLTATLFTDSTATVSTFVSGNSNTWALMNSEAWGGGGRHLYFYYAYNANAGTESITITPSASSDISVTIAEYGSIQTTPNPLDKNAGVASQSGNALDSGTSGTLNNAHELVVGAFGVNCPGSSFSPTFTAGGSFVVTGSAGVSNNLQYAQMQEDQVVSATTALDATATSNGSGTSCSSSGFWAGMIATFVCASGTCPTATHP
jgi:hypothetical protein